MLANWVHVNRHAANTLLVIPGWGLLPGYFSESLPHHNLWVLNAFLDDEATPGYLQRALGKVDCCVVDRTVNDAVSDCDAFFICSMGLQWADAHLPNWSGYPCVLASPSVSYLPSVLRVMNRRLVQSPRKTLTEFYKQCFGESTEWAWWQHHHLHHHLTHLTDRQIARLTHWLCTYGIRQVTISHHAMGRILVDPNDPIGQNPPATNPSKWSVEPLISHLVQRWPIDDFPFG